MTQQHNARSKTRTANAVICDLDAMRGPQASPVETAQYLAEMASELVLMAKTAGLERLSLLLDFVAREAEAEAESSGA